MINEHELQFEQTDKLLCYQEVCDLGFISSSGIDRFLIKKYHANMDKRNALIFQTFNGVLKLNRS